VVWQADSSTCWQLDSVRRLVECRLRVSCREQSVTPLGAHGNRVCGVACVWEETGCVECEWLCRSIRVFVCACERQQQQQLDDNDSAERGDAREAALNWGLSLSYLILSKSHLTRVSTSVQSSKPIVALPPSHSLHFHPAPPIVLLTTTVSTIPLSDAELN